MRSPPLRTILTPGGSASMPTLIASKHSSLGEGSGFHLENGAIQIRSARCEAAPRRTSSSSGHANRGVCKLSVDSPGYGQKWGLTPTLPTTTSEAVPPRLVVARVIVAGQVCHGGRRVCEVELIVYVIAPTSIALTLCAVGRTSLSKLCTLY